MDSNTRKVLDRLESEYQQYASSEKWTRDCLETMKNIQKLMYYIEVRDAMKNGYDDFDDYERSYRSGRHGMHSYDRYYNMGSGRRYYDDEKEHAKHRLQTIHDSESNPEVRDAIMKVMHEL